MAAVSTGFVGSVRFNFLAEEREKGIRAQYRDHLILDPPPRYSPVLLDSEKEDPEQYEAILWPPASPAATSARASSTSSSAFPSQQPELLWVNQLANPTDLRHTRPVSRHKLLVLRSPVRPRPEWTLGWRPEWPDNRAGQVEAGRRLLSQASDRCQEWSTLRQLLPSRGCQVRGDGGGGGFRHRRAWEAGGNLPPAMTDRPATAFPRVASEMTRYCDAMFVNDKNFWNR